MKSFTLQGAITEVARAIVATRDLRLHAEAAFSDRVDRAHMMEISSAINDLESASRILTALANDPLEDATPANIYGMWNGKPVTVPTGYELIPRGEPVTGKHMRLIDDKRSAIGPEWKERVSTGAFLAQVYPATGGRTVLAFARRKPVSLSN